MKSKYFKRHEFACKCGCGFDAMDIELITVLEYIREYVTQELQDECYIIITSGCRCVDHNTRIGGAINSQHVKGKAADFKVFEKRTDIQVDSDYIYDCLNLLYPNKYGIGKYDGRTHLDVRINKARWDKTTK